MSSPNSVNPNSFEANRPSSPLKEVDQSYDSREAPEDQNPQKANTAVKKPKRAVKKQPAQTAPEEAGKEAEDVVQAEGVNPEANKKVEKKKKKKNTKKAENADDQGSDVTANFPKPSVERRGVTDNSETNPVETKSSQKEAEQEAAAANSKAKKKKTAEVNEDVIQEEKSKKPAKKNEKPKDLAVSGAQKTENIKPQPKQGVKSAKNIEVNEAPAVVSALISPSAGKGSAQNKRNLKTAENERYGRNGSNSQAKEDAEAALRSWSQEKATFVPIGKAATLKKSPTQEELPPAPVKPKKGPIRSKIETGLSTIRVPSKTADISTVSFAATTRVTNGVRSPSNIGQRRTNELTGQKSYGDMSGIQKSYALEKIDTQGDVKKNKAHKRRMRSFDAGKTDKIRAEDSFETRNKMWQVRKAEKLLEKEKERSRDQNEACTFNPTLVSKRVATLDVTTSSVYDRGLEWTQKVKSAVQAKGDQILEEKQKAEPKKPRIKSVNNPPEIRTSKVCIEGFTGPQFGLPKTINVPSYSQEPLKFSGNLEQKISEIHDVYDSVSAALKKKSINSKTGFKEVAPKSAYVEAKSASRISISSQKERAVKLEPANVNKGDEQRMSALKQMLNLNQKEKKSSISIAQAETNKGQPEQNPDYLAAKADNTERIVPKNGQRVEIRNNRYVIVNENEEC